MTKDFWNTLPRPIIGLSPMDGYTDSPFRRICKTVNPHILVVTEFTSAEGLNHLAPRIVERFRYDPSEQPIIAQIFGGDERSFVHAAQWLQERGFAGIDINMGCPAKKVIKSEQGFALRRNHDLAFQLVEVVARATTLPVSVKTRLGMHDASDLITFGKGCESAGANMITIHGRTYDQPYGVPANFSPIDELKKQLTIPVLCNGGITSISDGKEKLGDLDGFLIGQAAIGNPWVFTDSPAIPFAEKVPLIKQHAAWIVEMRGEKYGVPELRKHLIAYVKRLQNAHEHRMRLGRVESLEEVYAILETIHD